MGTKQLFVVADNQDLTRAGICTCLRELFKDCQLEEVHDKQQLSQVLTEQKDCVVILDYTLFNLNGIEDLLIMLRRFPQVYWLLCSSELSESLIRTLSVESNVGMVLKDNSMDEIRTALICADKRERFLCHQLINLLITQVGREEPHPVLTAAEMEILKLIVRGKSVKEIASERSCSIHTIVTHKKNIFRKLDVNNVYEATKYALRTGLIEMVEYYI